MALHQTALYVGIVASSFAATVGQRYGWRNAFFVFGSGGILMAGVLFARLRDTPAPMPRHDRPAGRTGAERRGGAALCVRQRTVLLLSVAFAGQVFVNVGYLAWMPTFLHKRYDLPLDWASFLALFCHHAAAFVGVTAGGWLSDRLARRQRTARMHFEYLGLLLGAPFIWWMDRPARPPSAVSPWLDSGCSAGSTIRTCSAAPFDVIAPRYRSSAVGLMLSCAFVMGASASTILAWIAEQLDMATAISSMGAVYVVAGLLVLLALATTFGRDYYAEDEEKP